MEAIIALLSRGSVSVRYRIQIHIYGIAVCGAGTKLVSDFSKERKSITNLSHKRVLIQNLKIIILFTYILIIILLLLNIKFLSTENDKKESVIN